MRSHLHLSDRGASRAGRGASARTRARVLRTRRWRCFCTSACVMALPPTMASTAPGRSARPPPEPAKPGSAASASASSARRPLRVGIECIESPRGIFGEARPAGSPASGGARQQKFRRRRVRHGRYLNPAARFDSARGGRAYRIASMSPHQPRGRAHAARWPGGSAQRSSPARLAAAHDVAGRARRRCGYS